MDGMVVAVTRQCESRRQRAEHAGTTNQPWGSETPTILRHHRIITRYQLIVFVCLCMCWQQAFPLTPHTIPNDCPPYGVDVASGTGNLRRRPAAMQNTAVAL
jgi:hypothetical protein